MLGFSLLMPRASIIHLLAEKPKIAYNTMIWYISILSIGPSLLVVHILDLCSGVINSCYS